MKRKARKVLSHARVAKEYRLSDLSTLTRRKGSRITAFHIAVVGLSLLLTIFAWQFSKMQIDTRIQQRFDIISQNTAKLIFERLGRYEDALWAGVATINSHGGDISFLQWQAFAKELKIEQRYPGSNGIGVIHFHTAQTLDAYIAKQQVDRPDFTVKPSHDFPFFMPITVITPRMGNEAAVGLDVAHETNRRTAAFASRDTGLAQITGPITLVQDARSTPGFLFYAPFYKAGRLDTAKDRQARFVGAVYAPVILERLMEGLLSTNLRTVSFSLKDGSQVIYDEHASEHSAIDPEPMHKTKIPIPIFGRTWVMDIESNLAFRAANTYTQPTFILVGGLIVEGLIIALLVLMSRANRTAISYADHVTTRLRQKSEELAETVKSLHLRNDELEQFTYVASHDLKTPVRGIGGLVEIIEEDLEDYFESADANPEVQRNLVYIQDRVKRMTELTTGILEYSKVGSFNAEVKPVSLTDIVTAVASDFNLGPDQFMLSGDVTEICYDTFNFRRVLDNLVGNAIKYHDGQNPLLIQLTVHAHGDTCKVCVRDNGPGIDPAYHAKIFEVFQALRLGNAPESTGIGLAIVKKAVELHGGAITLISAPGQGAEFSFDWPHDSLSSANTKPQQHVWDAA